MVKIISMQNNLSFPKLCDFGKSDIFWRTLYRFGQPYWCISFGLIWKRQIINDNIQQYIRQNWKLLTPLDWYSTIWCSFISSLYIVYTTLGVQVRNMKMDFNTRGTWRQVGQWRLMMKINDFFIRLSRYQAINNNM